MEFSTKKAGLLALFVALPCTYFSIENVLPLLKADVTGNEQIRIIDNNDPSVATKGQWVVVSDDEAYGNTYLRIDAFNPQTDTSSSIVRYTFGNTPEGAFDIWATWKPQSDLSASVPVEIYNRSKNMYPITSGSIDQTGSPVGTTYEGSDWQKIGSVDAGLADKGTNVNRNIIKVDIQNTTDQAVQVDAFLMVPQGTDFGDSPPVNVDPVCGNLIVEESEECDGGDNCTPECTIAVPDSNDTILIIDSSDTDIDHFAQNGKWETFEESGYQGNYDTIAPYDPAGTATVKRSRYKFKKLPPGTYYAYATWQANDRNATNATYTFYGNQLDLGGTSVDQTREPDGPLYDGMHWKNLGPVPLDTGNVTSFLFVELYNEANGYVVADAVLITKKPLETENPVCGNGIPEAGEECDGESNCNADCTLKEPETGVQNISDDSDDSDRFKQRGEWTTVNTGYNGTSKVIEPLSSTGEEQYAIGRLLFADVPNGSYDMYFRWSANPERASNAPFRVKKDSTDIVSTTLDQKMIPGDIATEEGLTWKKVASNVVLTDGPHLIRMDVYNNDVDGSVSVDAGFLVSAGTSFDPAPSPVCGNSLFEEGEECEDGNTTNNDGCSGTCQREVCGDSIIQSALDEECDDGNTTSSDGCSAECKAEYCGDGIVTPEADEQCDDGNNDNEDGCSAECRDEVCGDGVIQTAIGEECDDGNEASADGCSAECKAEYCGDGIVTPELGEQCDDGNTDNDDQCSVECKTAADVTLTMLPLTETSLPSATADILLFRLSAKANSNRDITLQRLDFEGSGMRDLHSYSLWLDTNGDNVGDSKFAYTVTAYSPTKLIFFDYERKPPHYNGSSSIQFSEMTLKAGDPAVVIDVRADVLSQAKRSGDKVSIRLADQQGIVFADDGTPVAGTSVNGTCDTPACEIAIVHSAEQTYTIESLEENTLLFTQENIDVPNNTVFNSEEFAITRYRVEPQSEEDIEILDLRLAGTNMQYIDGKYLQYRYENGSPRTVPLETIRDENEQVLGWKLSDEASIDLSAGIPVRMDVFVRVTQDAPANRNIDLTLQEVGDGKAIVKAQTSDGEFLTGVSENGACSKPSCAIHVQHETIDRWKTVKGPGTVDISTVPLSEVHDPLGADSKAVMALKFRSDDTVMKDVTFNFDITGFSHTDAIHEIQLRYEGETKPFKQIKPRTLCSTPDKRDPADATINGMEIQARICNANTGFGKFFSEGEDRVILVDVLSNYGPLFTGNYTMTVSSRIFENIQAQYRDDVPDTVTSYEAFQNNVYGRVAYFSGAFCNNCKSYASVTFNGQVADPHNSPLSACFYISDDAKSGSACKHYTPGGRSVSSDVAEIVDREDASLLTNPSYKVPGPGRHDIYEITLQSSKHETSKAVALERLELKTRAFGTRFSGVESLTVYRKDKPGTRYTCHSDNSYLATHSGTSSTYWTCDNLTDSIVNTVIGSDEVASFIVKVNIAAIGRGIIYFSVEDIEFTLVDVTP